MKGKKNESAEDKSSLEPIQYPPKEDIYNQATRISDIDPDDLSRKPQNKNTEQPGQKNELDYTDDHSGSDLDIPGAELDDDAEATGNEDEENNYYSIGGDEHNDLEEEHE